MIWILSVITVVFAFARFIVPVEGVINHADFFKDFAHIFVGILFGYAIAGTKIRIYDDVFDDSVIPWHRWALAIGLTAVEVVAFAAK